MTELYIGNDTLFFKNLSKRDLPKVLHWYNNIPEYKFATGFDKPITLRNLYQKYSEVIICRNEFFIGIYLKPDDIFIGVIRGGINNKSKNALWVNSIIIESTYQNKGYGTKAINLLIDYVKQYPQIKSICISVIAKNTKAISFWEKLGFVELRKMDNRIVLDNEVQDVIIMEKVI